MNQYPETIELLSTLAWDTHFIMLDLKHAYQHFLMEEFSTNLVTIKHIPKRLPIGVSSAPAVFQRMMKQILPYLFLLILEILLKKL